MGHLPFPDDTEHEAHEPAQGDVDVASVARMVCADNRNFLQTLETRSVKLIVTSPPYNIGKEYEKRRSLDAYLRDQEEVIARCYDLLHPLGSLCWQVGNHVATGGEVVPLDLVLYPIFKKLGLRLRNRIVWHFGHGLHCKRRFSGRYETILWFTKGDEYTFNLDDVRVPAKYPMKKYFKGPRKGQYSCNPLGKNPGDVWNIPNVKANHCEKTSHPCQFPVELVERLVLALTDEEDSVLDPYMGVGSALVAAVRHRRFGLGCDICDEYVQTALGRLRLLLHGQLKTRPMGRPVHDPTASSRSGGGNDQ
jgi:adenine-specific DNA-methyltransferase